MSKNHSKSKTSNKAVSLAVSPPSLINLMMADPDQQKKAAKYLIKKGSKHKRVLRTLLLSRLLKLVRTLEKSSGLKFSLQRGYKSATAKDKKKGRVSLPMPIHLPLGQDDKKVSKSIRSASPSQALFYASTIQVLEWAIQVQSGNKAAPIPNQGKQPKHSFLTIVPKQATNGELEKAKEGI